jgi:hypothetical protein
MDKLKGIPTVYYTNLGRRSDRRKYMEDQFKKYEIPFVRWSIPEGNKKYLKYFLNHQLIGEYSEKTSQWINWSQSIVLDYMSKWIKNTDDKYMIYMEDDYDLSLIELWHFDWNQLMNRLPYDWDCILLGFESPNIIPFYLHPTKSQYSLGPCLLKREYIEKLLDLHVVNNKFKFDYVISNQIYIDRESGIGDGMTYEKTSGTLDYFIAQSGNSYSIPLLRLNPYFDGVGTESISGTVNWFPKLSFIKSWEAYLDWWTYDRDKFTLDDFFTYGKDNDILMERDTSRWNDKYFRSVAIKNRKQFKIIENGITKRKSLI